MIVGDQWHDLAANYPIYMPITNTVDWGTFLPLVACAVKCAVRASQKKCPMKQQFFKI